MNKKAIAAAAVALLLLPVIGLEIVCGMAGARLSASRCTYLDDDDKDFEAFRRGNDLAVWGVYAPLRGARLADYWGRATAGCDSHVERRLGLGTRRPPDDPPGSVELAALLEHRDWLRARNERIGWDRGVHYYEPFDLRDPSFADPSDAAFFAALRDCVRERAEAGGLSEVVRDRGRDIHIEWCATDDCSRQSAYELKYSWTTDDGHADDVKLSATWRRPGALAMKSELTEREQLLAVGKALRDISVDRQRIEVGAWMAGGFIEYPVLPRDTLDKAGASADQMRRDVSISHQLELFRSPEAVQSRLAGDLGRAGAWLPLLYEGESLELQLQNHDARVARALSKADALHAQMVELLPLHTCLGPLFDGEG